MEFCDARIHFLFKWGYVDMGTWEYLINHYVRPLRGVFIKPPAMQLVGDCLSSAVRYKKPGSRFGLVSLKSPSSPTPDAGSQAYAAEILDEYDSK